MNERTASLKYNFEMQQWIAIADWDAHITSSGGTPTEAMEGLAFQCNKHELWPMDFKRNFIGRKP